MEKVKKRTKQILSKESEVGKKQCIVLMESIERFEFLCQQESQVLSSV